jgi:hypothetical protein
MMTTGCDGGRRCGLVTFRLVGVTVVVPLTGPHDLTPRFRTRQKHGGSQYNIINGTDFHLPAIPADPRPSDRLDHWIKGQGNNKKP